MKNSRLTNYLLLAYGIISIAIVHPMASYHGGFMSFLRIGPGIPGGIFDRFLFFLGTGSIAIVLSAYGMLTVALKAEIKERGERQWINAIRWIARIVSLVFILLVCSVLIAHQLVRYFPSTAPTPIAPLVLGALMLIGLGLAWKWELPGAVLSLVAFIGLSIIRSDLLAEPTHYIAPLTAILYLLCSWASRSRRPSEGNVRQTNS